MFKNLPKYETEMKKIEGKLKTCNAHHVLALKKAFGASIGEVRDAAEDLGDAASSARADGVTGNKLADFMKADGFKTDYEAFQKVLKKSQRTFDMIDKATDQAIKLRTDAELLQKQIDNDLKGNKETGKDRDRMTKLSTSLKAVIETLKCAASIPGTLPTKDVMYVTDAEKAVETILADAKPGKSSGGSKEVSPLLDEKALRAGATKARNLTGRVAKILAEASKAAEADTAKAGKLLKAAQLDVKKFKQSNDALQKALKRHVKDMKKAENRVLILKFVQDHDDMFKACMENLISTAGEVKSHA